MKLAKRENIGKPVVLHCADYRWNDDDAKGVIVGIGQASEWYNVDTHERYQYKPYRVKLDKSSDTIRVHAEGLYIAS